MALIPNPSGPSESSLAQKKRQEQERAIRKLDELLRRRATLYAQRRRATLPERIQNLDIEILAIRLQLPGLKKSLNGVQLAKFTPAILRHLKI